MAFFSKDGTAQGVAKIRHYESLLPTAQQLYHDPYAYGMFRGSIVQSWIKPLIPWIYRLFGLDGMIEMISVRTRWLDDQIILARKEQLQLQTEADNDGQLIILGAGYDTRGFRLVDLWNNHDIITTTGDVSGDDGAATSSTSSFHVIEVDQPEVQEQKVSNMKWLMTKETKHDASNNDNNSDHHSIAHLMESNKVSFLPVNFVTDNLQEKLSSHTQYSQNDTIHTRQLNLRTFRALLGCCAVLLFRTW